MNCYFYEYLVLLPCIIFDWISQIRLHYLRRVKKNTYKVFFLTVEAHVKVKTFIHAATTMPKEVRSRVSSRKRERENKTRLRDVFKEVTRHAPRYCFRAHEYLWKGVKDKDIPILNIVVPLAGICRFKFFSS